MSAGHDAGAVPLVVPGRREDAAFAALCHPEFPYFATAMAQTIVRSASAGAPRALSLSRPSA